MAKFAVKFLKMKKLFLQTIAVFSISFNCWGANFAAIMYGEKYPASDFEISIPHEFILKFPADKYEIFILTEAVKHKSDFMTCTATVGISPVKSFQYPQKTFTTTGYEMGGYKTEDQRREHGLNCLKSALKQMTSSNLDLVYSPVKR